MRLWRSWVALWARRESAESLALLRVLLGCCVLAMVVTDAPMIDAIWVDQSDGGMRDVGQGRGLVAALGGHTRSVIGGLLAGVGASALTLTLGVFPRLSALVCLQLLLALASSGQPGGSQQHLVTNILWLLVFARSDATLSLTARLRTGQWCPRVLIPAWPRYLAILQLVIVYQSAGLQKVSSHWLPGGDLSALYLILQQVSWYRHDLGGLWAALFPLTRAATLGVWCLEVGSPVLLLLLFYRDTRTRPGWLRALCNRLRLRDAFIAAGVSMHLGILLLMAVGTFSALSLSLYACVLHPDEWRALLRAGRPAARST